MPETTPMSVTPSPVTPAAAPVIPPDWPELNARRHLLIHKKYDGGLSVAEAAELGQLQSLADAVVDSMLPPLLLTPAERAYIEAAAARK